MENMTKYEYSDRILEERRAGRMEEAILTALQAREYYPEENIFEKFLGDLYFQEKNYESAGEAYLCFVKKIGGKPQYAKHFAGFLKRYSEVTGKKTVAEYCRKMEECMDNGEIDETIALSICEMLAPYRDFPQIMLFQDDIYFEKAVSYLRKFEDSCRLYILSTENY